MILSALELAVGYLSKMTIHTKSVYDKESFPEWHPAWLRGWLDPIYQYGDL